MSSSTVASGAVYRAREQLLGYDEALLARRILILGGGAVGGAVAQVLAMWGFRRAVIVDHDTFEPSNAARVADFPFEAVLRGEAVPKAPYLAARWAERLRAAGEVDHEVIGLRHYAQELPPHVWRSADLVISVVDHPRARYDVARLARRYDRQLVTGGFDGGSRGVSASVYPAHAGAACLACITRAPGYAASDTSCSVQARRARELEKLPATPALATLCAGLVAQLAVDTLHAPSAVAFTRRLSAAFASAGAPDHSTAERSPSCCGHRAVWEPIRLPPSALSLGELLEALEAQLGPSCALVLPCELPVIAPSDGAAPALLRVARPPWRVPGRALDQHFRAAPPGSRPLVIDRVDRHLGEELALLDLPVDLFGLGPGARFEVEVDGGAEKGVEWNAP